MIALLFVAMGFRKIRPTHRAVVERLGKYHKFQESGLIWVIPFVDRQISVNITEQMVEAGRQEVITSDNLNAMVDVQAYYKIKDSVDAVKASLYGAYNAQVQIVNLLQTTLRNVIGTKDFKSVNSLRGELNTAIKTQIEPQITAWGMEIVRVELKEVVAPKDVQDTMNAIIKASNEKKSSVDFASAKENEADGIKRASIKKAEGDKQSALLTAQGKAGAMIIEAMAEAKSIKLVNESANEYFKGNAQLLKQFEVNRDALEKNTKIVFVEKGMNPMVVIGEKDTIIPMTKPENTVPPKSQKSAN